MKKTIILTVLILFTILLFAQKQPEAIDDQIKAKLTAIVYEVDNKLKPVFAKNEKLQSQMQQELKALAKITDPKQRSAAIQAYQAKYKSSYGVLMKQAGVDMVKYAKDLNTSFPTHQFTVTTDFSVTGKLKPVSTAPPKPVTTPVTTPVTNYTFDKHTGCGGIAGGNVTSTSSSITGTGLCAVAGGCNNYGSLSKTVSAPQQSSTVIRVAHKAKVEAFAVGIAGLASSYASTSCSYGTHKTTLSVTALAPLLWVGYAEDEETRNDSYTIEAGRSMFIYYGVYSANVSALPGESNSKATITGINNTITTQL